MVQRYGESWCRHLAVQKAIGLFWNIQPQIDHTEMVPPVWEPLSWRVPVWWGSARLPDRAVTSYRGLSDDRTVVVLGRPER